MSIHVEKHLEAIIGCFNTFILYESELKIELLMVVWLQISVLEISTLDCARWCTWDIIDGGSS